jgi:hypothetical protein
MARSINKLPVRVYKNNKNAALTLADDAPHTPIIKNNGISTLSKKI